MDQSSLLTRGDGLFQAIGGVCGLDNRLGTPSGHQLACSLLVGSREGRDGGACVLERTRPRAHPCRQKGVEGRGGGGACQGPLPTRGPSAAANRQDARTIWTLGAEEDRALASGPTTYLPCPP